MDTTGIGWAVQRTGAGRERAGEPVDPHAGILFHARLGANVEAGQPLATLYASNPSSRRAPRSCSKRIRFRSPAASRCRRIFTRESAEAHLADAVT